MSLFGTARKIVDKAQRYAQQNPDKIRGITDKAARFADKRTRGRYRSQIDDAVRKVDGVTGGGPHGGPPHGGPPHGGPQQGRSPYGSPDPRRDDTQDPYRDGPPYR